MQHKCADCGFLAARNIDARTLDEVEWSVRQTALPAAIRSAGALAQNRGPDMPMHEPLLVCFKQEKDLIGEANRDRANVLGVINAHSECNAFIAWKQGFTPREHQEMADRNAERRRQEEREEADRKWQAEQKEAVRRHQENMAGQAQRWQDDQEKRNRRYILWGALIGGGAALVASGLAVALGWALGR